MPQIDDRSGGLDEEAATRRRRSTPHSTMPQDKPTYPYLSTLVMLYRLVALLALVVGVAALVERAESTEAMVGWLAYVLITPLTFLGMAEAIRVFLSLEQSARASTHLLEVIAAKLKD